MYVIRREGRGEREEEREDLVDKVKRSHPF